jgi:hypothetical protein
MTAAPPQSIPGVRGGRNAFAWWASTAGIGERQWRRGLVLIIVVAALARVAIIVATPNFVPWGDPADFQRHAASIAAGHGYPLSQLATPGTPTAFRPPAYPFLLGGAYAIAGTHRLVGRLLGAALGVLAVALLAYLGRAGWDRRTGLLVGGLGAAFPPLIALSGTLLSESLFLPVELGLALTLLKLSREPARGRWALLAGVLCGLAALTRTIGIVFLVPSLAVLLAAPTRRAQRARSTAALVVATLVVLAPWTIRNADAFHALVPVSTQDGFTLVGQYNQDAGRDDRFQAISRLPVDVAALRPLLARLYFRPGGVNEAQLDSALRHAAFTYFGNHPVQLPVAVWLSSLRMVNLGVNHEFTTGLAYREMGLPHALQEPTTLSAQLIALIALAGALAGIARRLRFRLGPWWLWAIPVLAIAATVPVVGTPRYRAPADPFLLMFVAVVLGAVGDGLARRAPGPWRTGAREPTTT